MNKATPHSTADHEPILAPEEIDALMQAVMPSEEANAIFATLPPVPQPEHIEAFDFAHITNSGPERYPLFATLQQRMTEALKELWSETFQRDIVLEGKGIQQRLYEDILADDKKEPQVYFVYDVSSFGRMVVAWDLKLTVAYIDAMLGGTGDTLDIDTDTLSPVELKLSQRIGQALEKLLAKMWAPVSSKEYSLQKVEVEAQFLGIAAMSDMCFSVQFTAKLSDDFDGFMHIHYPRTFLEPVLDNLRTATSDDSNHVDTEWQTNLEKGLAKVPLDARLEFGQCQLDIQQFLSLKPGDFLPLSKQEQDPATLWVNTTPLFEAMPGSQDGLLAAELLEPISQT